MHRSCEASHVDKCTETCPCLKILRPVSTLTLYTDILRQRKENDPLLPDPLDRENSEDFTYAMVSLKKDYASGKAVWFNVWYQDIFVGLRVNHPLIGMIWPPKGHPFTRLERIYVFVVGLMVALFWTIIFEGAFAQSSGGSSPGIQSFVNFLFTQALGGSLWLFNAMMVFAAECGCAQGKGMCCRNFAELVGKFFLLVCLALGICHIILFAFAYSTALPVVKNGFASRYVSGILSQWFLWSFVPFLLLFYRARKRELEAREGVLGYVISFQETETYMASLKHGGKNGGEPSLTPETPVSVCVEEDDATSETVELEK